MQPIKLFHPTEGVHVLVDGQFGSTGKGALAAWLALQPGQPDYWQAVVSNAGPNSGHTFYYGSTKHVLKQLPTFAVAKYLYHNVAIPIYLSAGAVIDWDILCAEARKYPALQIHVHRNAALIGPDDKAMEGSGTVAAVAGTRSGTGVAIARKVLRDPTATLGGMLSFTGMPNCPANIHIHEGEDFHVTGGVFVEVSQGFSLGLNSSFYPKVTSRECTVAQGLADARISPRLVEKVYMAVRTFPIRVGDVDGHSAGGWYGDQRETSWDELGVPAERTTVTNRVRRVATFSMTQFRAALRVNDPDFVFLNFMNYLDFDQRRAFVDQIHTQRDDQYRWFETIEGYGPKPHDISANWL